MAIIRIYSGPDGQSHFDDVELRFEPRGDQSETAELIPGSGIIVRRFDPRRSNPWHPRARPLRRVHALRGGGHRDRRRHGAAPRPRRHPDRGGPDRPGPRHARGRARPARVDLRPARRVRRRSHENTRSAEGDTRRALVRLEPPDDGPDPLPEADTQGLSSLLVAGPLKPNKK